MGIAVLLHRFRTLGEALLMSSLCHGLLGCPQVILGSAAGEGHAPSRELTCLCSRQGLWPCTAPTEL